MLCDYILICLLIISLLIKYPYSIVRMLENVMCICQSLSHINVIAQLQSVYDPCGPSPCLPLRIDYVMDTLTWCQRWFQDSFVSIHLKFTCSLFVQAVGQQVLRLVSRINSSSSSIFLDTLHMLIWVCTLHVWASDQLAPHLYNTTSQVSIGVLQAFPLIVNGFRVDDGSRLSYNTLSH